MGGDFISVEYEEEGTGQGGYAKTMSEGFQRAQRAVFEKQAKEVDIIITTALIPGRPAPKLITAEMVRSMKPGSVIVDMAAEQGGNCALTVPNEVVVRDGVTIIGYSDLPSRLAKQSSTLYATNLFRLAEELCKTKDGIINVNMSDDVLRGTTVIKEGAISWPPPPLKMPAAPAPSKAKPVAAAPAHAKSEAQGSTASLLGMLGFAAVLAYLIGTFAPSAFLAHFTVFVLAWDLNPITAISLAFSEYMHHLPSSVEQTYRSTPYSHPSAGPPPHNLELYTAGSESLFI